MVSLRGVVDYRERVHEIRALKYDQGPLGRAVAAPSLELPPPTDEELRAALLELVRTPLSDRLWYLMDALRLGVSVEELHEATWIDPWFLVQMQQLVEAEATIRDAGALDEATLRGAKELGFSDAQIAALRSEGEGADVTEADVRAARLAHGVTPSYARVDTCAAEFVAHTPYLYSAWGRASEADVTDARKVMILGGGPNRIGQGIEFDYCCVHAAFALAERGFETLMVNCNPETVSTDFDTSDRLYFEPLTFEDVMAIVDAEKPEGVIVQYGGQTPLRLAVPLSEAGVNILGTRADAIDRAEDRERFEELLEKLNLRRPRGGIASGSEEAMRVAEDIGYPLVVRPSYVLGGRAMEIVHSRTDLARYFAVALQASEGRSTTILLDEFLRDAIEVDVDCVSDGEEVIIGGLLQHIEQAGVHSGDSSMVLPAHALPPEVLATIRSATRALALELGVVGLMNVQFAIRGSAVYVIEVNPRASRTVPFVSKATGVPLAQIGAKVMAGATLHELGVPQEIVTSHVAVKESVFPFAKFPGVDTILGPEMRSTGEVMGIAHGFASAFLKAQLCTGLDLPDRGAVFVSVRDEDKAAAAELSRKLVGLGFEIVATGGTATTLERAGVAARRVNKVYEGRPHCVDMLANDEIAMVINTTAGERAIRDSYSLRRATLMAGVPYFTTIAASSAAVAAIESRRAAPMTVRSLQEYHVEYHRGVAPRDA